MRPARPLAVLVAVVALCAPILGCGSEEPGSQYAAVAERAVRDVAAGDAVLLDVRTAEEFESGHAADVVHLPLARIEAGARPDIPKDAKLYVYCRTGRRAAIAVDLLRKDGFRDVTNIGGLADWRTAGGGARS